MKVLIILNILCFILFSAFAVLQAMQGNWGLTALWSVGALCWVVSGILKYKTYKMRGH
jgi:uncharacterized membrane protein